MSMQEATSKLEGAVIETESRLDNIGKKVDAALASHGKDRQSSVQGQYF